MGPILVSIIVPVYNAAKYLDKCFNSILNQDFTGSLQISVYNDSSTDESKAILENWHERFSEKKIDFVLNHGLLLSQPKGAGYAKNQAIYNSSGRYLCFLDADDWMDQTRVSIQYDAAIQNPNAIIGSRFLRDPPDSTVRYTRWSNSLDAPEQLYHQAYTSHGPTIIMPTWFCSREIFDKVGGFDESGKGTPEDLIFFYKHLSVGGKLHRCAETLVCYRYHPGSATFSVSESVIWKLRVEFLEEKILSNWKFFSIWNAGKQGRKLYRSLSAENKKKVLAFCDVDEKKIKKEFYIYEESKEIQKPKVPIIHFRNVVPPVVICVKMDLTGGDFENNLKSLDIVEGTDWIHFN